jgi:hypothetical protein
VSIPRSETFLSTNNNDIVERGERKRGRREREREREREAVVFFSFQI